MRDTEVDVEPPADWDKPTPKVLVPPPPDPFLRGVMETLNELGRYLRTDAWRIQDHDTGEVRALTEQEVLDIVQTLRNRVGV